MPERPLADHPPLTLAQRRTTLDALLRDRVRAMLAVADDDGDQAAALDALVREFVEQVDRINAQPRAAADQYGPLDYERAVLIEGDAGPLVVHADTYDEAPLFHESRVAPVERVVRGTDVLAVLRDTPDAGDARTRLGLT